MKRFRNPFTCLAVLLLLLTPGAKATIVPNPTVTAGSPPSSGFLSSAVDRAPTPYLTTAGTGTFLEFDFGTPQVIDGFVNVTTTAANTAIGANRLIFDTDGTPGFNAATDTVRSFTAAQTGSLGQGFLNRFAAVTAQKVRWEVLAVIGAPVAVGSTEMAFLSTCVGSAVISPVTNVARATELSTPLFAGPNAVNGIAGISAGFNVEYASRNIGANTFMDFDLGSAKPVCGFDFYDRFLPKTAQFQLIFSNSPSFSPVINTRSYNKGADNWTFSDCFLPVTARYIRYDVTAGTGDCGVGEITFYTPNACEPELILEEPAGSVLSGGVLAWGNNNNGQSTPPAALQSTGVTAIAAGTQHSLALKADGTVVGWGLNTAGQTAGQANAVAIAAGAFHSLALRADGSVVAWGDNSFGETTVPPAAQTNVAAVAGGGGFSLALKCDGTVVGWGYDGDFQASGLSGYSGVTAIAAGGNFSLGLLSNGTVAGAGDNSDGAISIPPGLTNVVAIAAGGEHSVALTSSGTIAAWGWDAYGQVSGPNGVTGAIAISAGGRNTMALMNDGSVRVWGLGTNGQTTIPAAAGECVTAVAAGGNGHVLALKYPARHFGSLTPGMGSVMKTFTLRNTGPGSLAINSISTVLGNSADFVVASSAPVTLAPWTGSTTFTVKFQPTALGLRKTQLRITDNDRDERILNICLTGNATPPANCDCQWEVSHYEAPPTPGIGTLAAAEAIVQNPPAPPVRRSYATINFADPQNPSAASNQNFPAGDVAFLGDTAADDDTFVTVARGLIHVPVAGTYTFGFSSDDGARLTIYGASFISPSGNGSISTYQTPNDSISYSGLTGNSHTMAVCTLAAGLHQVEFLAFENTGGSHAELFYATGSFGVFNSTDFHLLGDTTPSNAASSICVNPGINHPPSFTLPTTGIPAGQPWFQLPTPTPLLKQWNSVAGSADMQKLVAVVENGQIYRSNDTGATWTADATGNKNWTTVCASSDGTTMAACEYGGKIWRLIGSTWTPYSSVTSNAVPPPLTYFWYGIACSADGQYMAATENSGGIYTSSDAGATWKQTPAPFKAWRHIASSSLGNRLLAAAQGDQLYLSEDYGATWAPVTSASTGNWRAVALSSDGCKMWAAKEGGLVYYSPDAGLTWTPSTVSGNWLFMDCTWDGSRCTVANNGGVLHTFNLTNITPTVSVLGNTTGWWSSVATSSDGSFMLASEYGPQTGTLGGRLYSSLPQHTPIVVQACNKQEQIANFATNIMSGPLCEACQTVSFTVTNTNNPLFTSQPTISPTGTLTFATGTTTGNAFVYVIAQDTGGTANGGWGRSVYRIFQIQVQAPAPKTSVSGLGQDIVNGDTTPSTVDGTDFGSAPVCGSPVDHTFSVCNTGCTPLFLLIGNAVQLDPASSSDFSIVSGLSGSIQPNTCSSITIRYTPTSTGPKTARVWLYTADPFSFDITGTGTPGVPEIAVSGNGQDITDGDTTPALADHTSFGTLGICDAPLCRTFTVTNSGCAPLDLTGTPKVALSGTGAACFSVTAQPASPVNNGTPATFTICFDPSVGGTCTATVRILSNDSDEALFNFDISGQGTVPEIAVTGKTLNISDGDTTPILGDDTDFGSLATDAAPVCHTFTITNSGAAALDLTGTPKVTLSGAGAGCFSIQTQPSSPVAANGGTTTFTICFDPTVAGICVATVNIPNCDPDEAPFNFDIKGEGTLPCVNNVPSFTPPVTKTWIVPCATGVQTYPNWATAINDNNTPEVQTLTFNVTVVSTVPAGPNLFSVPPAINSTTGALTFTPSGTPGKATLAVTLTDDTSVGGCPAQTSAPETFTIYIGVAPDIEVLGPLGGPLPYEKIYGWGSNEYAAGQPGAGVFEYSTLTEYKGFKAISTGNNFTVAVRTDGTVTAWGYNGFGGCNVPATLNGKRAIAVSAGDVHAVALADDGTVHAWGAIGSAFTSTVVPADLQMPSIPKPVSVLAGSNWSMALTDQGTIRYWGAPAINGGPVPPSAATGWNVKAIAGGAAHAVALLADGTVNSWNAGGLLSTNPTGNGFTAISASNNYSLALRCDGTVVMWGSPHSSISGFVAALAGKKVIHIVATHATASAILADGSVISVGFGGLADEPTVLNSPVPNPVGFAAVGGYSTHTMALYGRELSFPCTPLTTSTIQKLTVKNTGNCPLNIASISKTGANAGDFSVTPSIAIPAIIPVNGSMDVDVSFTPGAPGTSTATLSIVSDDPDESPLDITLTGKGAAPGNAAPTGITLTTASGMLDFIESITTNGIDYSPAPSIMIGSLSAQDQAGDTHTFSLADVSQWPDNAAFVLVGKWLRLNVYPDFETKPSYQVCVLADDGCGGVLNKTFTINILNRNDKPFFFKGPNQCLGANANYPHTYPAWATGISDGDTPTIQNLSFSITPANSPLFSVQPAINSTTGDLTYTPAPNASGSVTLTVTLTDDALLSPANQTWVQTFTITIDPSQQDYTAWATQNHLASPNDGDQADFDGDGKMNLLEYAFNSDPNPNDLVLPVTGVPTTCQPIPTLVTIGGTTCLQLTYVRRKCGGVAYVPEYTNNTSTGPWIPLTSLTPAAGPVVSSLNADWEQVSVCVTGYTTGRVRVVRP